MMYYCPYCNRSLIHAKGTPTERTDEHFIPQSIGGSWSIKVCRNCNGIANKNADESLKKIAWTFDLFKKGIANKIGIAQLKDGRRIEVHFKYQSLEHHHQFIDCTEIATGNNIRKEEVEEIEFSILDRRDTLATGSAISKIALASAYYLVGRHYVLTCKTERLFKGQTLAALREKFMGKHFFPGQKGKSRRITLEGMNMHEAEALLSRLGSPEVRRHYISLSDSSRGIKIEICLYSTYFWRAHIPNEEVGCQERLEQDQALPELTLVDPKNAAKEMSASRSAKIIILIR